VHPARPPTLLRWPRSSRRNTTPRRWPQPANASEIRRGLRRPQAPETRLRHRFLEQIVWESVGHRPACSRTMVRPVNEAIPRGVWPGGGRRSLDGAHHATKIKCLMPPRARSGPAGSLRRMVAARLWQGLGIGSRQGRGAACSGTAGAGGWMAQPALPDHASLDDPTAP